MEEQGPIDLIRLVDMYDDNSVVVRVTGRDTMGDPQVLVGEISVSTKFAKGTLKNWIFPADLAAWETVLNLLVRGENATWRKDKRAPELHVDVTAPDLHEEQVRVSVVDRILSMTTVRVLIEPPEGWIEDQRALLARVRQTWPQPQA